VVLTETDLNADDWVLLCTDGLHRVVPGEEITAVVAAKLSPAEMARELTARANQHGGPDNVSVIVCQVGNFSDRDREAFFGR
jgi:protein phosphatase